MRDLIELVDALPWRKLKTSPVWDSILEPGSKMARLFELAQGKAALSDEAAALDIYGSSSATGQLQRLKNKLKTRLLDVVLLLDYHEPNYSDRQKAHFECNKNWATAMTLLAKKARHAGIELLEQTLRHSRHFEFTELTLNALNHLRLHYGTVAGDTKKYEMYRDQYKQYQAVWMMENEAEELYTQLISRFVCSKAPQEEVAQQAEAYFRQIEPSLAQSDSFRLHLSGRLLQLMVYSSRNDYQTMADLCEQALAFFQQKPYESHLPQQAFYYQLVVSCVQLRDFGRGQAIVRQHQHIYEEGSFNWFKIQELYFLLALHTQHYDDAFDTCALALGHAQLEQQPETIRETWRIYEAYSNVLVRTRRADRLPARKFKPARFLNETPVFSKDKRGMNIPILVVQILFDILDQRYDACIDRVEAIGKYASRYITKDEHFRSNCFLKMLLQIPEAGFHREAAVRKAEKYLEQLRTMPIELANQPYEIEIIPYEELWEMVLLQLSQKRFA
ncbi:MAG: hypothetical protein IT260_15260 [Saprospiraceae bacterium]|nr:hypothetical protein [Saprospiraceae bacterium]